MTYAPGLGSSDLAAPAVQFDLARPPTAPGVLSAARTAAKLLNEACARREQILARASAEAEAIYQRAHSEGFAEGRRFALEKLLDAASFEAELYSGVQSRLVDAVLAVAEEVIGAAIKEQPEAIVARIERAARLLAEPGRVKLHVHPEDAAHVTRALQKGLLTLGAESIDLTADPNLTEGSARLETSGGTIEAALPEHLTTIRRWMRRKACEIFPIAKNGRV